MLPVWEGGRGEREEEEEEWDKVEGERERKRETGELEGKEWWWKRRNEREGRKMKRDGMRNGRERMEGEE